MILEFLDLDWTPEFDRGFSRCHFEAGRVDAFRHDLDPHSLDLLDASLGRHLVRWGYR